ncbi:MAG: hypothetical protein QOD99_2507 [Chthoniobacter sp.]|jgi:hypothetical protein|nr:hypothetical protein [Chthoniobacter sp.]
MESESTPTEPAVSKTRWLKSAWSYEQLNDKKVFATFITKDGLSYEGTGVTRVRRNPEGLLAVGLVFTRHDGPYQRTDIIYHLSSRQLPHLERAADDEAFEFRYAGNLTPDNDPS